MNSLELLGAVNGDGASDSLIGVPYRGDHNGGYVDIRNGATGALIRRKDAINAFALFGLAVASAGDLDGDGIPDYLVGAPHNYSTGPGTAYVMAVSGLTNKTLFHSFSPRSDIWFGLSIASMSDINGDGRRELVIGAYADDIGGTDTGSVFVEPGKTAKATFRHIRNSVVAFF